MTVEWIDIEVSIAQQELQSFRIEFDWVSKNEKERERETLVTSPDVITEYHKVLTTFSQLNEGKQWN